MKTLEEVRQELGSYDGAPIKIMEVCGTHTASIFKNGIRSLISDKIKLISGPGCPVCVTSPAYVDKLVEYSLKDGFCVLTFGDMMKVKGSEMSLTEAKAVGGNVQVLYSPLQSLQIAQDHPGIQYIFAAVGFETTTPIYALLLDEAIHKNTQNLKILTSLKTVVPALSFICENEKNIDAFICPGHVSVITGSTIYKELAEKYKKPFVIAGFEGEHIISAICEILHQIKREKYSMKNMYISAVSDEGNVKALDMIHQYFEICSDTWRGIGVIENSALRLKNEYWKYDAGSDIEDVGVNLPKGCKCQDVILGRINPNECPLFMNACSPMNAVGPCMVSTEGACGIWFKNRNFI